MIRGVFLFAPNGYGKILANVLDGIPLDSFLWKIEHIEAYSGDTDGYSDERFDISPMAGNVFFDSISKNPDYLLLFGEFSAFHKESDIVNIRTYHEFLESLCELIVLINDVTFVEVYAKNFDIIEKIKKNGETLNYKEVEYITDENDQRKIMSIMP